MTTHKAHHHVPRFHLKWFTPEETRDGKLWVTDTRTGRQWGPKCIDEVATENGFYKANDEEADPMIFEKMLGTEIEPTLSTVIEYVISTLDVPNWGLAKDAFLNFVAITLARTQAMKKELAGRFDEMTRNLVKERISTEEGQRQFFAKTPNLTVEKVQTLLEGDNINISPTPNTYLLHLLKEAVDTALHVFAGRRWYARRVAEGSCDLICSNVPIGLVFHGHMFGLPLMPWLEPNAFVVVPLSRRVAAIGATGVIPPTELSTKWVTSFNRAIATGATQLYSAEKSILR